MSPEMSINEARILIGDLHDAFNTAGDTSNETIARGRRRWVVRGNGSMSNPPARGIEWRTIEDTSITTTDDRRGNEIIVVEYTAQELTGAPFSTIDRLKIGSGYVEGIHLGKISVDDAPGFLVVLGIQGVRSSLTNIARLVRQGTTQIAAGKKRLYTPDSYGRRMAQIR